MTNRPLFLCLLLAALCIPTCVRAAPEVFVLRTRHRVGYDAKFAKQISGLLPRELARQALMIAAREELGLATRDQSLREKPDAAEGNTIDLLLTVDATTKGEFLIRITQSVEGNEEELWSRTLNFESNSTGTYSTTIPQLEVLSRGDFVELLQQLGAEKRQSKDQPGEASPAELEALDLLLAEVDLTAQFLAVRRIETLIAERGESAELLGRLSNGYANLSLLAECAWGPTSRVLKARSLLYAERLRAKYADYLFVHWHWAYARAITGIHFAALEQLADPLPEGVDVADLPSLPAWAEVIEPYCRYDTEELGQLAEVGNRWARYLRMWSFYLADEERQISNTAEETVNDCPMAFNLYYLLAHEGSLGIMHRASQASIRAMYHTCAVQLAENTELPEATQAAAAAKPPTKTSPLASWEATLDTLRAEPDSQEPSWQTLATLLEDSAVVVAAANLHVGRGGSTERSLVPYVEAFLPALKHHPHVGYFLSRKYSSKNEANQVTKACRDLRFEDPSLWIGYDTYHIWGTKNSRGERVGYNAFYGASRDFTASSLYINSERPKLDKKFQKMLIRELKKVSPYSPMALVNEIKSQIPRAAKVESKVITQWEERAGVSSTAWHQLGQFYVARREYDKSYPCFETSFTLSPSYATARDWGWAYEWAKDLEKVVPTMKRYLEEEDHGLGHSNTHYEIASFYLRQNRAEEAKPHALKSAQSWSGRGLSIAAKVSERLKLNEEAEKWYQALSEAYPSYSGYEWYLWRRRSGSQEDIAAPRKLAQHHMGPQQLQECKSGGWWPLAYYLMESDLDQALKLIRLRLQQEPGLYSDAFLLAIAQDREDPQLVDEALKKIQKWAKSDEKLEDTWSTRFAKTIDKILAAESADEISYETIDPLIRDKSATIGWCDACYFLSKFLEAREFTELAARYRNWAISFNDPARITWHLAGFDAHRIKEPADTP